MAYKTRASLQKKLDMAYEAAKAKEGRELTVSRISRREIVRTGYVYRSEENYLLYDGRYVMRMYKGNDQFRAAIDNLPVSTLQALFEIDHEIGLTERYKRENEDCAYQSYLKREAAGEEGLSDPLDAYAYRTMNGNPESIFLNRMCPDQRRVDMDLPPAYTASGRFDENTALQAKILMSRYIAALPPEEQELLRLLFMTDMKQTDIARLKGCTPAYISKQKKIILEGAKEMFRAHGYQVPDAEAKKKESRQRKRYEDHYKNVSKILRKAYFPDEEDAFEEQAV